MQGPITHLSSVWQVVTVADYDEYCHYVAGLVGEGLSRLFGASATPTDVHRKTAPPSTLVQSSPQGSSRTHELSSAPAAT